MTGFGRGESKNKNIHVVAEVRSVNNRFLDIVNHLPKSLNGFENEIKDLIRKRVNRGRINLFVSFQSIEEDKLNINIDYNVANSYKKMLTDLKDRLDLAGHVELEHILKFSEIFSPIEEKAGDEELVKYTTEAVVQALEEMHQMKVQEGQNLSIDMLKRLDKIEDHIHEIEQISRSNIPIEFNLLKDRIKEILQSPEVDPTRLEMEIAILADRLDVTEESVRFNSHIQLFRDLVKKDGFVGRRLNFLVQEMNREANTISSKANNSEISHRVVFIKEEIERLREQIQNIE
jgi:uncharacterized protein (TIGR00255 family)